MKVLKWLLVIVAAIAAILAIVGLAFVPRQVHVERSALIDAPPSQVYPLVSGFGRFNEWSPWADLDPAARYEFSGPAQGAGARMSWRSDKPEVGVGSQEVLAATEDREVRVRLTFEGQGEAMTDWTLEADGERTRATWSFDMDLGMNPLLRWMGLMIDGPIGADYERGLARLKVLAEREAAEAREAEAAAAAAAAAAAETTELPAAIGPQ